MTVSTTFYIFTTPTMWWWGKRHKCGPSEWVFFLFFREPKMPSATSGEQSPLQRQQMQFSIAHSVVLQLWPRKHELLGQKVLCLHSDLGIFPKGTNYNGVFCDMGTHPLWIGLHPPTHFVQAMEHPSDGNDSHSCAMLRKSRSLPAE